MSVAGVIFFFINFCDSARPSSDRRDPHVIIYTRMYYTIRSRSCVADESIDYYLHDLDHVRCTGSVYTARAQHLVMAGRYRI